MAQSASELRRPAVRATAQTSTGNERSFGVILIVEVGWLLATLIAKAVASLLPASKCNDLSGRAGFTGFMLMDTKSLL